MNAGTSLARPARARHRHQLRTLTYVTLDQANGGVIRNLSREGIAVQVVAAVRPRQQMRVRFELRYPRLRVETRGEVIWATFSGQCGIRFLDMSPRLARQIDEWIFGNLLESAPPIENDGLMMSAAPVKVIELPHRPEPVRHNKDAEIPEPVAEDLDWLSQPLSGRSLAWTVNSLAVVAGLLLFALIFLSVTHERPRWPLATTGGAAILVAALYWGFFKVFGGPSPGARLARLAGYYVEEEEEASTRFR
jgi:hypothetical protein